MRPTLQTLANVFRARPVLATFEVCLRCNQRCGYCDLPLNQGRYEMTRDEVLHVFRDLRREGLAFVFVQGGEPLVRSDLLDVLGDLRSLGLGVGLVTNGVRLRPQVLDALRPLGIAVAVSLDTLDRARYRAIRGADHLPRVLEAIDALADYPHPKFVASIVTGAADDTEDVVRYAAARGLFPVVGAYHHDVGRYGRHDPLLTFTNEQAAKVFDRLLEQNALPPGYYRTFAQDNADWLRGRPIGRCDAGRYSVVVDASGQLFPCLAHPPVGNLLETPARALYHRFDHRSIRACSDRGSCNLLCGRLVSRNLSRPVALAQTRFSSRRARVETTLRG